MDAKPKSNKLKRLEKKRKLAERTERQAQKGASSAAAAKALLAERRSGTRSRFEVIRGDSSG